MCVCGSRWWGGKGSVCMCSDSYVAQACPGAARRKTAVQAVQQAAAMSRQAGASAGTGSGAAPVGSGAASRRGVKGASHAAAQLQVEASAAQA